MRDKRNKARGDSNSNHRDSQRTNGSTKVMAYDYRAPSNELFPTSVQANLRLPTGRPFLVRNRTTPEQKVTIQIPMNGGVTADISGYINYSDSRNNDAIIAQRPRFYLALPDTLNDTDRSMPMSQWIDYAVQQMYTGLRLENRSNVGYSVLDLKEYLVQVISLYAYARAAATHMMCFNMSDPRCPALQAALCGPMGEALTFGDNLTSQYAVQADDVSHLPIWMRDIQASWSIARLAADQLSTLPIPARMKQYIDYLLGSVFVDESVGGQYFKLDLSVDFSPFTWISINRESSETTLAQYFMEGATSETVWKAVSRIATALSGPTATKNTMVSDLRRLAGMVPCVIDLPSDFGALPNIVVNDALFFDTLDNSCYLSLGGLFSTALPEFAPAYPSVDMGEVRVDASTDIDNPGRLAMITSLMSVDNNGENGALNSFTTPFVYGGTLYIRQEYMQYGLEEHLMAYGEAYPSHLEYATIYGSWIGKPFQTEDLTYDPTVANLEIGSASRMYAGRALNVSGLDPVRLVRFGQMEHHPALNVLRVSNEFVGPSGDQYTSFPEAAVRPRLGTQGSPVSVVTLETMKNFKEGTRVSINALNEIQYYAWASLLRL